MLRPQPPRHCHLCLLLGVAWASTRGCLSVSKAPCALLETSQISQEGVTSLNLQSRQLVFSGIAARKDVGVLHRLSTLGLDPSKTAGNRAVLGNETHQHDYYSSQLGCCLQRRDRKSRACWPFFLLLNKGFCKFHKGPGRSLWDLV